MTNVNSPLIDLDFLGSSVHYRSEIMFKGFEKFTQLSNENVFNMTGVLPDMEQNFLFANEAIVRIEYFLNKQIQSSINVSELYRFFDV